LGVRGSRLKVGGLEILVSRDSRLRVLGILSFKVWSLGMRD
jgi:hypothetical protein